MGCAANRTSGSFDDTWEIEYGNQFNKSFVVKDSNGKVIPMGHITAIDIELYLTEDFTGTPYAVLDGNWQNEDASTGVIEATMLEAVVNELTPGKEFAFGQIVLTDDSAGAVDYVKADVLFVNFSNDAVT